MSHNITSDDEDNWDIYDNDDYDYDDGCSLCEDGYIIVCMDDLCRASDGCGRFSDPTCYKICPNGCF